MDMRILFPPHLTDEDQAGETTGISKGCFNVRAMHKEVCREKLDREENALTQYVRRIVVQHNNAIYRMHLLASWRVTHQRALNLIVFALVYVDPPMRTAK